MPLMQCLPNCKESFANCADWNQEKVDKQIQELGQFLDDAWEALQGLSDVKHVPYSDCGQQSHGAPLLAELINVPDRKERVLLSWYFQDQLAAHVFKDSAAAERAPPTVSPAASRCIYFDGGISGAPSQVAPRYSAISKQFVTKASGQLGEVVPALLANIRLVPDQAAAADTLQNDPSVHACLWTARNERGHSMSNHGLCSVYPIGEPPRLLGCKFSSNDFPIREKLTNLRKMHQAVMDEVAALKQLLAGGVGSAHGAHGRSESSQSPPTRRPRLS
jgi:hypothetical protein